MTTPSLEDLVFARHVETQALQLQMVPRFWPYGELLMLLQDKVELAVRPFGRTAMNNIKAPTRRFLDRLIETGGFSTKEQELGGTMHQFQDPGYRNSVLAMQEADPIVREARRAGPDYWERAFADAVARAA